jgi:hypothetical protein
VVVTRQRLEAELRELEDDASAVSAPQREINDAETAELPEKYEAIHDGA